MFYLKPKKINIVAGGNYVVLLNEKTSLTLDIHPSDRIYITNGPSEVVALLDVSPMIKDNEIGLYTETWNKLKMKRGDHRVSVILARKPRSIAYIRAKLDGEKLTQPQFDLIAKDIVSEKTLSDVEMGYFVAGCYINGLTNLETAALAKAIVKTGNKLKFKNRRIIFDKHCIGGVPGNRTTMIVVPICACAGLIVPKTSSRAITSPAGTADTLEVLAKVDNDAKTLKRIALKTGAFMTWGAPVKLAGADDHLIRIRNPLSLDPESLMLASIMAKKKSVSATDVLIDIPCGPTVKVKNKKEAVHLKKRFLKIGKLLKMNIKVAITDGSQPIGNGIGPVLECLDVLKVLKNDPSAPADLREKSLHLAGMALEMCRKAKPGEGYKAAAEILDSGRAYKKFNEIISAQGRKKTALIPGKIIIDIKALKSGTVKKMNNFTISRCARLAGAPVNPGAGIYFFKKIGDKVRKGDVLFRIYAESETRIQNALTVLKTCSCYLIN